MGTQLRLPQRGIGPQFSAHVCCGQTARWIKMPLGREVGLGRGNIVLNGDPARGQTVAHLSYCWTLVFACWLFSLYFCHESFDHAFHQFLPFCYDAFLSITASATSSFHHHCVPWCQRGPFVTIIIFFVCCHCLFTPRCCHLFSSTLSLWPYLRIPHVSFHPSKALIQTSCGVCFIYSSAYPLLAACVLPHILHSVLPWYFRH